MELRYLPGSERYGLTPDGRVHSVQADGKARILATDPDDDGYPCVRLTIDGRRRKYRVHRLMASLYLPERPGPGHQIRHLDGDRSNASSVNLAWGTPKQNAEDRDRHGRTSRGRQHAEAIRRARLERLTLA
jgi:hypothetical protein